MSVYLIDANLPYYFAIWSGEQFIHVNDINDAMPDSEIWEYAKQGNLTIVTKDTDFSDKIMQLNQECKLVQVYKDRLQGID